MQRCGRDGRPCIGRLFAALSATATWPAGWTTAELAEHAERGGLLEDAIARVRDRRHGKLVPFGNGGSEAATRACDRPLRAGCRAGQAGRAAAIRHGRARAHPDRRRRSELRARPQTLRGRRRDCPAATGGRASQVVPDLLGLVVHGHRSSTASARQSSERSQGCRGSRGAASGQALRVGNRLQSWPPRRLHRGRRRGTAAL